MKELLRNSLGETTWVSYACALVDSNDAIAELTEDEREELIVEWLLNNGFKEVNHVS